MNMINRCETCVHEHLCVYKNEYQEALKAMKNMKVAIGYSDEGTCVATLSTMSLIGDVDIQCVFYIHRGALR